MMQFEYKTLANGVKMPGVGFGVYKLTDPAQCEACVRAAVKTGYRLIDTAGLYLNEEAVGKAVRGCGVPREELFVATKVWIHQMSYEGVKQAYQNSLRRLGLEYVDLLMLHWPFGEDVAGAWRAMEELYKQGKVRAIGVCNFAKVHMEKLLETAEILPMVDQMECHPLLQLEPLRQYLAQKNILLEAWAPLARMNPALTEDPVPQALAKKYGRSLAQIVLRWHYQRGVIAIPKSSNPERIAQNFDLFDFSLTPREMEEMGSLDKAFHVSADPEAQDTFAKLSQTPTDGI